MAVTIRDVARTAGVSVSTVSRVLTGNAPVAPERRRRVVRATRALGYRPNVIARSLKQRRTTTLALVVPDITNLFFAEVARGVEDAAHRLGYALILCNAENDLRKERRYLEVLRERQVDGLVLVPVGDRSSVRETWTDLPLVLMDRVVPGLRVDAVACDNESGVRLAVRHLVRLGHRRIGFIGGPRGLSTAEERARGFLAGLREAGLRRATVARGPFAFETGLRAMERMLRARPRPTAVVASSDVMALGAIRAVYRAGGSVPETVSVVGYDGIAAAALVQPPLTTVAQPMLEMGRRAVELLVARITGTGGRLQRLLLRPQLVVRESTAGVE